MWRRHLLLNDFSPQQSFAVFFFFLLLSKSFFQVHYKTEVWRPRVKIMLFRPLCHKLSPMKSGIFIMQRNPLVGEKKTTQFWENASLMNLNLSRWSKLTLQFSPTDLYSQDQTSAWWADMPSVWNRPNINSSEHCHFIILPSDILDNFHW